MTGKLRHAGFSGHWRFALESDVTALVFCLRGFFKWRDIQASTDIQNLKNTGFVVGFWDWFYKIMLVMRINWPTVEKRRGSRLT